MKTAIISAIAAKLFEFLKPYIEEQIKKLLPELVEKITALLPMIVAAVTKSVTDQFRKAIPNLPDLSVPDLAEEARKSVNQIPDIDIPVLSDLFDLTEWLKSR